MRDMREDDQHPDGPLCRGPVVKARVDSGRVCVKTILISIISKYITGIFFLCFSVRINGV